MSLSASPLRNNIPLCSLSLRNIFLYALSLEKQGHRVSVVNDYADTKEIILLWKKKEKRKKVTKNEN